MKLIIPNFWKKITITSIILLPFSWLYQIITNIKSLLQKIRLYHSKAKIITIGNITIGGAGKTPITLAIAKMLLNQKIAILTRGYKGSITGPIMVSPQHKLSQIGDEALLLSKYFSTCVAKNRLSGIKYLENLGYKIIITDDGLQDERFFKDLSIMVVDGNFGFGNKLLIPAGPLRESIASGIAKTDLAIIIGNNSFYLSHNIVHANVITNTSFKQQKFIAFAGIGNPDKFFNSLKLTDAIIVKTISFADHHSYSDLDIQRLITLAQKHQAKLITTEKDYVRISEKYKSSITWLAIEINFQNKKKLDEKITSLN